MGNKKEKEMPFTKKEQETFENMFWKICQKPAKSNKNKLESLADLLFELTGNVNLRMWLFGLKVT